MRGIWILLPALLAFCCTEQPPSPGVLYDFESEEELDRITWQCRSRFDIVPDHATSGERALRCDFGEVRYPGLAFHDFPGDLSGIHSISMDLFNESGKPLTLVIRIDDAESGAGHANRYNGSFVLEPGANRIAVPMESVRNGPETRTLDLARIERFLVFLYNSPGPVTIYLDRIALK